MSLLTRLSTLLTRQQVTQGSDAGWSIVRGQQPTAFTRDGRTIRRQGVESNAVVHSVVRLIAQQLASVPLEAYRVRADGEIELLPDSPLQALLDQPGPQLSRYRWLAKLGTHLVTYGNALTVLERTGRNGAVQRLRVVHPERLSSIGVESASDLVAAYHWTDSVGVRHTSPYFDVLHIADLDTDEDGWFGFPRLASAMADIISDSDATSYVRQTLANAGVPSMVMLAEPGADVQELKAAEDVWHERMAVRGGRGKVRFVGGIREIQVIGHTLSELEFPSLRQVTREDICAAAGVDPRMVGVSSATKDGGMSGAQYGEARRRLEQQTVAPLRQLVCDALDQVLAPEFPEGFVRFSPTALAQLLETPLETATRVQVLMSANVLTLEEARAAIGAPETMDPAHHTVLPSVKTVAQALEAGARPPVALPPAAGAPVAPDGAPEPPAAPPADEAQRTAPAPLSRRLSASQRQALAQAFDARAQAEEAAYRDRAQALFALEWVDVRAILDAGATKRNDAFYDRVLEALETYFRTVALEKWARGFTADITQTLTSAGAQIAAELGIAFDLANPRVIAAVQRRVNKLTGAVADTTKDQLRVLIAAGREAGQGAAEVTRVIQQAVYDPDITAQRAELIARTETVGALNEGEYLAASEGGMRAKAWLTIGDGKERETHMANGQTGWIALDAAFPDGLQYPGDPAGGAADVIQCRCSMLYSPYEPGDAENDQPLGGG
jgi:HK97 family phage portal protein